MAEIKLVQIYIYMGVSVYWPLSVMCVFVCVCLFVCVISNQSTSKKTHVSDFSKLDALLYKTRIKILKLDMCTSMTSVSKIAHQIWRDHHTAKDVDNIGGRRQYKGVFIK